MPPFNRLAYSPYASEFYGPGPGAYGMNPYMAPPPPMMFGGGPVMGPGMYGGYGMYNPMMLQANATIGQLQSRIVLEEAQDRSHWLDYVPLLGPIINDAIVRPLAGNGALNEHLLRDSQDGLFGNNWNAVLPAPNGWA